MAQGQREKEQRENLGTRLGFILVAAGCAIGLGNVWRFPYIAGAYGGAWFVLLFVLCMLAVMPIMVAEFAIGRASRRNLGRAFRVLEPAGTHWHNLGWISLVGCYLLLMFYTVITGWLLLYCWHMVTGTFQGMSPEGVQAFFAATLASPWDMVLGMTLAVAVGFTVCWLGLQAGVERIVKILMAGLFLILAALVLKCLTLPGAGEGVRFFLMPDFDKVQKTGFLPILSAALTQAFFALSVGIGSMAVFGSYLNRERSLFGEALIITGLDFLVAFLAGLVIFPACFTYNVEPGSGPGLVFVALPNIFASMSGGQFWGALFFVFLSFAALTTVIGVFENLVSFCMDIFGASRRTATVLNGLCLWLLSLPCALGFNVLSSFQPFGEGSSVLDLEDFVLSNNLLPFGSIMLVLFCSLRCGWGWEGFSEEANAGAGIKMHAALRIYLRWVLPCIILFLFVVGYVDKFSR